jgi:hypothetical protein
MSCCTIKRRKAGLSPLAAAYKITRREPHEPLNSRFFMNWRDELSHVEIKKSAAKRRVVQSSTKDLRVARASATAEFPGFSQGQARALGVVEGASIMETQGGLHLQQSALKAILDASPDEELRPAAFENGWQRGPVLQLIFFGTRTKARRYRYVTAPELPPHSPVARVRRY